MTSLGFLPLSLSLSHYSSVLSSLPLHAIVKGFVYVGFLNVLQRAKFKVEVRFVYSIYRKGF